MTLQNVLIYCLVVSTSYWGFSIPNDYSGECNHQSTSIGLKWIFPICIYIYIIKFYIYIYIVTHGCEILRCCESQFATSEIWLRYDEQ